MAAYGTSNDQGTSGNPECPHCGGVAPTLDNGRTECGWGSPDHVPPVVPTFDFDPILEAVWEQHDDGSNDGLEVTTLDESLWDEDGFHPWDGLFYGFDMETHCTYRQTLETPAEYLTVGRLWVTDGEGRELAEVDAGEFQ